MAGKSSVDILDKCLKEIQEIGQFLRSPYGVHPPELSERISQLVGYHARLPEIVAQLDYVVYEAKAKASEELIGLYPDMGATTLKIKIEGRCKRELSAQKFAERLDSACVHQIDCVRSQLSYLKSLNDYGG